MKKYWPPVGRIDGAYGDKTLSVVAQVLRNFKINLPTKLKG